MLPRARAVPLSSSSPSGHKVYIEHDLDFVLHPDCAARDADWLDAEIGLIEAGRAGKMPALPVDFDRDGLGVPVQGQVAAHVPGIGARRLDTGGAKDDLGLAFRIEDTRAEHEFPDFFPFLGRSLRIEHAQIRRS